MVKAAVSQFQNIAGRLRGILLVWLCNLLVFIVQAPWDPNTHHDGFMYAGAIAERNGLLPNRDFFAQYGPLTPELQGFWLKLFSPTLLSLRVMTAILLSIIGTLVYVHLRKYLPTTTALLLTFGWALSSPRLLPTDLPWSSVITTLLILICIYLIPMALKSDRRVNYLVSFIIGVIIAVSGFARIHAWLAMPALLITVLFMRRKSMKFALYLSFGTIFGLVASLLYLRFSGIYADWFTQCVDFAFHAYAGIKPDIKAEIVNLLTPLFFIYFSVIFLTYLRFMSRKRNRLNHILLLLGIFLVTIFVSRISIGVKSKTFRNPIFMAIYQSENLHYLIDNLAIFAVVALVSLVCLKKITNYSVDEVLILMVAFATLSQLYPSPDALHVWWIAPVCLVAVAPFAGAQLKRIGGPEAIQNANLIFCTLVVSLFVILIINANTPRESYTNSVLKGMEGQNVQVVDRTMNGLQKFGLPGGIDFECSDGIYAVSGFKYLSASQDFVLWRPGQFAVSRTPANQIFYCGVSNVETLLSQNPSYQVIFKIGPDRDGSFNLLLQKISN
jgi:hypothetical protein